MTNKKIKNIFVQGAITPSFIADKIAGHHTKTQIGGHSIFLGQVRADAIEGKKVMAIEYTCNEKIALEKMDMIREDIFAKYQLVCMHVYHSIGKVQSGEICFFVFTSSQHRKASIDACEELVEMIKSSLPVWGREILEDGNYEWKVNI